LVHHRASVIIRTKNEQAGLGATLEAVLGQNHRPHQVLVIDSGSRDRTLEIARRYPVCTLSIPPAEWGYSRALNRAAAHAHGEVLVCLSAHCLPVDERWLGNLLRHFDDDRVAGVWGPQLRPGRGVPPVGPPIRQWPGDYGYSQRAWGLSNANSALRRCLWEEFPFDESLPAAEDKAWGRTALERGACIVHDPDAPVWHEYHSLTAAFRRQRAVNEGLALMFPEQGPNLRAQFANAGRAAVRTVRRHASTRDPAVLWTDVRRTPSSVAAIVGGMMARRPSQ
jgi:glycosyltransferase involved in cell wall biosynthesis